MNLVKERTKSLLWKLSPQLFKRLTSPHSGQVFSIGIFMGSSPFRLEDQLRGINPIITAEDIHDVPASFVADPFIVSAYRSWYLFFEVFNRARFQGEIGLAISPDGIHWEYQHIVLSETHHLAYPQVLSDGGAYYMVPDTPGQGVKLYRANRFPFDWQLQGVLLDDPGICDPTLFRKGEYWWMFSGFAPDSSGVRATRLHFSSHIAGPWTEHPASPIVADDPRRARPAGSIVMYKDRTFRLSQDCERVYGESISAHEILDLTTTTYREREVDDKKVLERADGTWIAAVDGWYMQDGSSNPSHPA
jgi:hypothetical protein